MDIPQSEFIRIMFYEKDFSMIRRRIVLFVKKERNCNLRDLFLKAQSELLLAVCIPPQGMFRMPTNRYI